MECPGDLDAEVDGYQVQQALLNLLGNAIDASPEGTEIRLAAESAGDDLLIDVVNAGDAIPPQDAERIFEPFFSTKQGGTGLGLAITRSIAQAHGGDLELHVNRPGAVAFRLVLPRTGRAAHSVTEVPCPAS